ncbi:MAG: hypothetical protein IIC74_03120 [Bacteroidetes bacterium]|nr:hypothetical protein [Bacteroidota bacterium]
MFIKNLTIKVTDELASETPKLTTWAASNWIPSVGSPHDVVVGSKIAVGAAIDAQNNGKTIFAKTYKLPQLAFVTNNVPYIIPLNEGSSTQAPSGFVQNAIAKSIKSVI